ncbi:MAG TPA: hypothetical protein EYG92_08785 [Lutibacter sp.]|nr:hypothetical protein [Lutibacter sp.]
MQIPKFLMGDHSEYNDSLFVIHTEYPRFVINLVDDEVHFFESILGESEEELAEEMAHLIEEASLFYDKEVAFYN